MLESGTLFALDIYKEPDTVITRLRLPGRTGATGDPGSDCFLCIIDAQRFQTGKPLLIRGSAGYVLAPLDLIPFTLQAEQKILKIRASRYQPVNGSFQPCLIAGSGLCCSMLNVALSLVLSGDDHGKSVFLAQPVAGAADKMVASLIAVVVLMIHEADGIENQVVMNMPLVNVGGQNKFILAAQDLICELHPDPMCFLRGYLPRGKGLYQVAAQVIAFVDGVAARPSKFNIRSFCGAALGRNQQLSVRFGWIADIVNGRL